MYTKKRFPTVRMVRLTWASALRGLPMTVAVCLVWELSSVRWLQLPPIVITVLATAVSFYLGFKGNSAYGRLWEARKIWGGIVNTSRTWGIHVTGFIAVGKSEASKIHRELVLRHVAWLAALRTQLRRRKPWEHNMPVNEQARRNWNTADMSDEAMADLMRPYVEEQELDFLLGSANKATQILRLQSDRLRELHSSGHFDDFRHMELARLLEEMFTLQGKAERIKNFPLPRQYSTGAHLFVKLFIQLLPLAVVPVCAPLGPHLAWLGVPATMLIAWVFSVWDLIVDYSENPFEGLINDIPMNALSRTIEVDLRQMLDDDALPAPIPELNGVSM